MEINTYENVVICKKCHQDLYVNGIEEKNMIYHKENLRLFLDLKK